MPINIEAISYYLFLIDSIFANLIIWFLPNWYKKNFKKYHKFLPLTKLWSGVYFVIILWLGYALIRLGVLFY